MCVNCWRENGSPDVLTPDVEQAVKLIGELYAIHPTGGPLHVVLDDWNLDGDITPYYDSWTDEELDELYYDGWLLSELDPGAPAVTENLGVSTRQLCDEIAALLTRMSEAERLSALARHDGFITA